MRRFAGIHDGTRGHRRIRIEPSESARRRRRFDIADIDSRPKVDILDGHANVDRAAREVKPSTGPWLQDARNVVAFANEGGRFDDLRDYLAERKLL